MYEFDLGPSGTSKGALTIIKQGELNLNLKFKTALPEGIMIMTFLVFDETISIKNIEQAIFDFKP